MSDDLRPFMTGRLMGSKTRPVITLGQAARSLCYLDPVPPEPPTGEPTTRAAAITHTIRRLHCSVDPTGHLPATGRWFLRSSLFLAAILVLPALAAFALMLMLPTMLAVVHLLVKLALGIIIVILLAVIIVLLVFASARLFALLGSLRSADRHDQPMGRDRVAPRRF
jgi:hypothetical protein